jgi:hypothetical protein
MRALYITLGLVFLLGLVGPAYAQAEKTHSWHKEINDKVQNASDCSAVTGGLTGDLCIDTDGEGIWYCPGPGDCNGTTAWVRKDGGAGGGEANTISSPEVGGLDLVHSTAKSGVDLRTVDAASADFDLAADVLSIDDTKWAKDSELHAEFTPNADPSVDHGRRCHPELHRRHHGDRLGHSNP